MDDPAIDPRVHAAALAGLRRMNLATLSHITLERLSRELAPQAATNGLRVLDLACGSGDVVTRLAKRARRQGRDWTCDGCDRSPTALSIATTRAQAAGLENVRFFQCDVLHDPLPTDYDILHSGLFLHHLTREEATSLLARMAKAARVGIIISDLVRGWSTLAMVFIATRFLSRSTIVHQDGLASVRAAWTKRELQELAAEAGLSGAKVVRCHPARQLLTWKS